MLYNNLPGIELTVKDGNLVLPAEDFGTGTVLIIAPISESITDGTINTSPKRVQSSEDFAKHSLGLFNKTNPLARLWKQVHDAGCRSIYAVELAGVGKELETNLEKLYSVLQNYFEADIILLGGIYATTTSVSGTKEVVDTFSTVGATVLTLTKTPDEESTFTLTKGETPLVETTDYTIVAGVVTLKAALAQGETVTVTYTTPDYVYADQLATFCNTVSSLGNQVIGVMAVSEASDVTASDLESIQAFIEGQTRQEYNQYLQIVGGAPVWFEINNEPYLDICAGAYAGMISVLPSYSAPTNKVIPGVLFPAFNLQQQQLQGLTNNHIVAPRVRSGKTVITEGITTANDKSDFVRLSTVRIVNDAVNLIREISDPYIGEPNTLARRNALETGIRSGLNNMIKRGALTDFRFSIKATLEDQISGNMRISLDLVPVFETRRIIITIALKPVID